MPWTGGHLPLQNNFSLVDKRINSLMITLEKDDYVRDHGDVFQDWLTEEMM